MYSTKLMMQYSQPPLGYIEDSSLLFKRENELWGYTSGGVPIYKTITNLNQGLNGITYCGTLPNILDAWLLTLIRYRIIVYRYANGTIMVRNYQNGGGIVWQNCSTDIIQPYIAVTLFFPTETTQTISLSVEGQAPTTVTGSWNGTTKDGWVGLSGNTVVKTDPMELALTYNRVLTNKELLQNYKTFLANHRSEV